MIRRLFLCLLALVLCVPGAQAVELPPLVRLAKAVACPVVSIAVAQSRRWKAAYTSEGDSVPKSAGRGGRFSSSSDAVNNAAPPGD